MASDLTDGHYGVGPYTDVYGHGAVTVLNEEDDDGMPVTVLVVCLDCGYVTGDIRRLLHEDCDRAQNAPINPPWRERVADEGADALGDGPGADK